MNFIYESLIKYIDNNIIEEAKTIEQIIDILKYKYQNVPENILMEILNIDPTKKKAYTQWVLSKWDNESREIERSLKNGKLKTLFDYVQNTPSLQLQTLKTFEDGISKVSVTLKSFLYAKHNDASDDFDIEYETDNWIIAVPNTSEASERLGKGCKWCTAGAYGDAESYFRNYTKSGPLYINFDLSKSQIGIDNVDYPFTRYQFSFEEKQFMDNHNEPISDDFKSIVPQEVIEFYEEKGYDTNDLEDYESRLTRYDNARYDHAIYLNDDNTLVLLQEYNEDLEYDENDDTYCLYDTTHDEQDSINNSYYKNDALVFSYGKDFFILKDTYGDFDIIYTLEKQRAYYVTWETIKVNSLIKLNNIYIGCCDDTDEIFAIDCENVDNSLKIKTKVNGKNIVSIFEDKDWFYVQNDNSKFYSLIKIKRDLSEYDFIVYKDVPKNHQQFEINQDGSVECVYDNYNIYEEKNDESKYMYEANLPDGNVLVSYYNFDENDNDSKYYDVIDAKTRKVLLKHFSCFLGCGTIKKANLHLIGVQWENDLIQYFNIGTYTPFGNPHKNMKNGTYCILCEDVNNQNSILFYDGTELNNLIFTQSIKDILNCKWISVLQKEKILDLTSLFDLEKRKYVFKDLTAVHEDKIYYDGYNISKYFGIFYKGDSDTQILVDLNDGIVLQECEKIEKTYGYNTKDFVMKQGNKLALYSMEQKSFIIPYMEATSIKPVDKKHFFIINNDKTSIFDSTTQRIMYVGNTSDISQGDRYSYDDIKINLGNDFYLGVQFENNYNIVRYSDGRGSIGLYYSNNPSKTNVDNVPDEIKKIMFNFSPQGNQITENFYKIYKKLI